MAKDDLVDESPGTPSRETANGLFGIGSNGSLGVQRLRSALSAMVHTYFFQTRLMVTASAVPSALFHTPHQNDKNNIDLMYVITFNVLVTPLLSQRQLLKPAASKISIGLAGKREWSSLREAESFVL
jgi:hypothetical protein